MNFILWGWTWEARYDRPSEHRLDGKLKRCWWWLWQWRTPYKRSWCCVRLLGLTLHGKQPHAEGGSV